MFRVLTFGALVGTSLTLVVATIAVGNPFGPDTSDDCTQGPSNVCFNENDHPRFWYAGAMNDEWVSAANDARTEELDGTTQIETSRVGEHDNSDVASYQENYGDTGFIGRSNCIDTNPNRQKVCRHWHEKFNSFYGPFSHFEKKVIACHEYGHTVGLNHYGSHQNEGTCMESSHIEHGQYNDHDRGHVNDYY